MQLSPEGKQHLEDVLTANAWTLEDLAEKSQFSISTIKKFSSGGTVHRKTFVTLCNTLEIDWKTASGQTTTFPPSQPDKVLSSEPSLDCPSPPPQLDEAFVQQVREHCRQNILNQHSRMRLLSGEEIGVDQLYVDVWLLEKPENKHFNSPTNLLKMFDIEKDRLALGKRIKRNPGFDITNKSSKLVILGKPGSGKTTFLKHLAVDWCNRKFQSNLIAVLIELRQIRNEQWDLVRVLDKKLGLNNWYAFSEINEKISKVNKQISEISEKISEINEKISKLNKALNNSSKNKNEKSIMQSQIQGSEKQLEEAKKQLEEAKKQLKEAEKELEFLPLGYFLKQGKFLFLMDGLDEVPKNKLRYNVQEQLRLVSEKYPENRFILTCRTQVMVSIPVGFTLVEVADFSLDQMSQFVQNWFKASGQSETKAKEQWEKINCAAANQSDLKELTATPVLLSLICLVLQHDRELPSDRSWLYQKGIKWLLSRWNDEKQIEGWEVGTEAYRKLKIEDKEALLREIAARKFENLKNFVLFEEDELAEQIAHQLHLSGRREGIAVLKAIETQHGLLIERADDLWSFSHLTFQEHFTIQWLTQLSPAKLAKKIENRQWQEIVQHLVKSQQPADRLLLLIKQAIDRSITREPSVQIFRKPPVQIFLNWLFQKSKSTQANYKPATIRAFYYALALALAALGRVHNHTLSLDLALAHVLDRALDRTLALDCALTLDLALARLLDRVHDRVLDFTLDLTLAQALDLTFSPPIDFKLDSTLSSDIKNKLQQLRVELLTSNSQKELQQWWQANGAQWLKQLRQLIVERDMGYDWQFTDEQKQQLTRYYDTNKFLVELMKIEGAVSDKVRAEIEETLLLPWDELQRRQPELYRERP